MPSGIPSSEWYKVKKLAQQVIETQEPAELTVEMAQGIVSMAKAFKQTFNDYHEARDRNIDYVVKEAEAKGEDPNWVYF